MVEEYTECEVPLFDASKSCVNFSDLKSCISSLNIEQLLGIHFWLGRQQFITREHEYTKVVEEEIKRRDNHVVGKYEPEIEKDIIRPRYVEALMKGVKD